MSLFRPPIVRSAGALLDRALFSKTIPTAAARVTNLKDIHRYRTQFEKSEDILKLERLVNVRADPDQAVAAQGVKCILLKPGIKPEGRDGLEKL
jgi:tRNA (guanine37-N1)-methyltransferase